jgi:hypothetical protein
VRAADDEERWKLHRMASRLLRVPLFVVEMEKRFALPARHSSSSQPLRVLLRQ